MNISQINIDWDLYYARATKLFKKLIEGEGWDNWTKSNKKYLLVTQIRVFETDSSENFEFYIASDNLEQLQKLWKHPFITKQYDCTTQHFIVDLKQRKVMDFLSICA